MDILSFLTRLVVSVFLVVLFVVIVTMFIAGVPLWVSAVIIGTMIIGALWSLGRAILTLCGLNK